MDQKQLISAVSLAVALVVVSVIYALVVGSITSSSALQCAAIGASSNDTILTQSTVTLSPIGEGITSSSATANNNTWLNFDGVNDFVTSVTNMSENLSGGYTFSIWVKTGSSNLTIGQDGVFLGLRNSTAGSTRPHFYIGTRNTGAGAQYKSRMFVNASCDETAESTGFTKDDQQWHSVIGVYNSTHVLLYVDGVVNDTDALSVACINSLTDRGFVDYGLLLNSNRYDTPQGITRSALDEARIYNRTLSDAEVTQIYDSGRQANSSLPSNGLVLWYSFDEAQGAIVHDKSGNGNDGV